MLGNPAANGAPKLQDGLLTGTTVTRQVAAKAPSWVVTVMVALPAATPVTRPAALTVAIAELLELQLMVLLDAFTGAIVAVS